MYCCARLPFDTTRLTARHCQRPRGVRSGPPTASIDPSLARVIDDVQWLLVSVERRAEECRLIRRRANATELSSLVYHLPRHLRYRRRTVDRPVSVGVVGRRGTTTYWTGNDRSAYRQIVSLRHHCVAANQFFCEFCIC